MKPFDSEFLGAEDIPVINKCPRCETKEVRIHIKPNQKLSAFNWFITCDFCNHQNKNGKTIVEAVNLWNNERVLDI